LQFKGQVSLPEGTGEAAAADDFPRIGLVPFFIGLLAVFVSVVFMRDLQFNALNLILWLGGVALIGWSFIGLPFAPRAWLASLQERRERGAGWTMAVTRWGLLVVFVIGIVLYFQMSQFNTVTSDMGSVQVENLLDV